MRYLKQFTVILLISFCGEVFHWLIPLPVPASIYGLLLMLLGLCTGVLKLSSVRECGKFLVEIMPVMFIPAAAGILESWDLIASSWVQYGLLTVVSTVAVMAVAGRVTQLFTGKGEKKDA